MFDNYSLVVLMRQRSKLRGRVTEQSRTVFMISVRIHLPQYKIKEIYCRINSSTIIFKFYKKDNQFLNILYDIILIQLYSTVETLQSIN